VYELPFTAGYPYLNSQNTGANFGAYGSFQILVVNALQAPSSVVNNIDFIVETAMGEGSEWYSPCPKVNLLPTVPVGASPTSRPRSASLRPPNKPQAGQVGGLVKVTTLSDAKTTNHQVETAQLCVGEKLLSLRQLIKYPCNLATTPVAIPIATDGLGRIGPQYYNCFSLGAIAADHSALCPTDDMLGLLAPYFRFSRGSMRVRGNFNSYDPASGNPPVNDAILVFTAENAVNSGLVGSDAAGNTAVWGGSYQHCNEGTWKVLVPAWQTAPMVDHHYVTPLTPADTTLLGRQTCLKFFGMGYPASSDLTIQMSRQPADDYELLFFIGPPAFLSYVS